jgi:hypothetical protein
MDEAGLSFRATKDLDIVLCIESLDETFGKAFWNFINMGGYEIRGKADGKGCFYRFQKPASKDYPYMLELFSRAPEVMPIAEGSRLTRISVGTEISSLSAILLDPDYYEWIQAGKRIVRDLPVVGAAHLIPLKARAWLDLRAKKDADEKIDRLDVKKHKNDILRLFQVVEPDSPVNPPQRIVDDMRLFLDRLAAEGVDLKSLGLKTITLETVMAGLRKIYRTDKPLGKV